MKIEKEIIIRQAKPEDSKNIILLHKAEFKQENLEGTIYAGHGIINYIRNLLIFSNWQKEYQLWVAELDQKLKGYAHFRLLDSSIHLNHIVVCKKLQNEGIGTLLYNKLLNWAKYSGQKLLTLDVDKQNNRAFDWYNKLGFFLENYFYVYEFDINPTRKKLTKEIWIRDWIQAEAMQNLYGFSNFKLIFKNKIYNVGRIGEKFFRLLNIKSSEIPLLKSILHIINKERSLLIVSPSEIKYPKPKRLLRTILRMKKILI